MATTEKPINVHIGLHKTGTTWLQEELFSRRELYRSVFSHDDVDELWVRPHPLSFDAEKCSKEIEKKIRAIDVGVPMIVSSELLAGNPLLGAMDSVSLADRIKATVPTARIIITLREQRSILLSLYKQYLLRGGTLSPQKFFDGARTPGYAGFRPEPYEYDRLVSVYRERFGENNVGVFLFEHFQQEPELFCRRLLSFTGASRSLPDDLPFKRFHGKGVSAHLFPIVRTLNHLREGPMNNSPLCPKLGEVLFRIARRAGEMVKVKRASGVSSLVEDRFGERIAASNVALGTALGIELGNLGYLMKV